MTAPYSDIVSALRQAFPQPVSDRVHDAYFVFSIMQALDRVDAMKSQAPLLGKPEELDYDTARLAQVAETPQTLEEVSAKLVEYLSGMFIWGHPRSQINVVPSPTIPSIIGGVLPSIYNPNLTSDESARRMALAEVEVSAMSSGLVGYDPASAGGVFTFGGTGTLLYAIRIGLEKACPGSSHQGLRERAVVLCSGQAHYACRTAAAWLGIGEDNVIAIPTSPENDMQTCLLESELRSLLKDEVKIAGIVGTMGSTDAFGIDDLQAIHEIRDEMVHQFGLEYTPQLHADAVIGWAWSVFNDYDFDENPLGFPPRTNRALAGTAHHMRHLGLSDSLGIDFHKTGFAPYISSLFLTRNAADFQRITRAEETMPYLFQSGHYHPGKFTLETSRSASGPMAALANLMLFGKEGLRSLLGHLVTMAETLREHLEGHSATTVLNRGNFGPVTLFRVYPDDVDTFTFPKEERRNPAMRERLLKYNRYNQRLFELVQEEALQGRGVVISLTDCYRHTEYGEPIVGLKSYIMSPFSEERYVNHVLESIWRARDILEREGWE